MRIMEGQPELILASASPRRQRMLAELGLRFRVHPAGVSEEMLPGERPEAYVKRLAGEKADRVAELFPGLLVLAADTTVTLGTEILGKPSHENEAREMLGKLSGRSHEVFTAVALRGPRARLCLVRTVVEFKKLSEGEIAWYVASREPLDKAGAYAIQGLGGAFVSRIIGSYSNVVGLPLVETLELLREAMPMPWDET